MALNSLVITLPHNQMFIFRPVRKRLELQQQDQLRHDLLQMT
jgi:predicted metal-dependent hydrolase